jgi:hypothetical protein
MERPYDPLAAGLQIKEEFFYVEIISVQIVQMDHIGVKFSDPFQEGAGGPFAAKSGSVHQSGLKAMDFVVNIGADPHCIFLELLRNRFPAIRYLDLMPLSLQRFSEVRT